jgi:aspartyl-tRNA(Asn)/glutamyl-tRNA(Gln) amidotransferase subunit A
MDYFESAGQVYCGSLHMTEFALGPTGFNRHYGHARNPWNDQMVCGGSSSGSAIAVSARMVFGAIGSDTGGSIRHPATMCGVTGLKPSSKLVNVEGTFPLSHTLDCVGPIAQTARDCAKLLTVLTNQETDYENTLHEKVAGLRIGIPKYYYWEGLDENIHEVLMENIKVFKSLGLQIVEIDNPKMEAINQMPPEQRNETLALSHEVSLRLEGLNEGIRQQVHQHLLATDTEYAKNKNKVLRDPTEIRIEVAKDMLGDHTTAEIKPKEENNPEELLDVYRP